MVRNCKVCEFYNHEEIGDSDFGAIYADTATCARYNDRDNNKDLINDFDRDSEKKCCSPDFFSK